MNIAINGFGRIGRSIFKILLDKKTQSPEYKIVAINDLTDPENLAYLLKYDSVYGRYDEKVDFDDNHIIINGTKFKVLAERNPSKLPWKDLGVDVVIESTGIFTKSDLAAVHLNAGAKKVILTAPAKDDGFKTYVLGTGVDQIKENSLISNASCTTNNVTPILKILDDEFGIQKSFMTTIHAYTATQGLVDGPAKRDLRRGRAAAQNIVPSSTGAADATVKVLPSMAGIFDGISLRVPVVCGSISDITSLLKRNVTVEEVNNVFIKAAQSQEYMGIVGFTKEQLVSSDIIKTTYSAIVDGNLTKVVDGNFVKVMAWYDNEWGYSNRVVDLLKFC